MSRTWRSLGLATVAVVLGACAQTKPQSEVPDGPSEEYEAQPGSLGTEDLSAEEAEQAAAKQAAQEVLEKVKDRDPEEEKKKMARSRAISAQARQKLGKGLQAEAVTTARQALKVHEQNVDAMLVIAEVYYKQGKYELTRAVASSVLQVDAKIRPPEDTSRAYNLQAFAMMAMGEDTLATQAFKKAAEVDDKNAAAWNNLGTRYLDAGDVATATACFEYAIELDPRFVKAQLNYGASLRAEGKWEEAETTIRKSLELRPNYPEAYFNLGVLYLDADPFPGLDTTQRLNKAIQNLSKYRELAIADRGARPGPSTPGLSSAGAKAPPPRVSKERADDYIRVAKKGLERETRRIEREQERQAKPATEPAEAGADPATGTDADPAVAGGNEPGAAGEVEAPGTGETPAPQGPGGEAPEPESPGAESPGEAQPPAKPTPQGPAKPTPQGPAKPAPSQPAPQGPSTPTPSEPAPSKPAPTKPAPTKPAPTKPAPEGPAKPAPTQPAPTKPAPTQPAPTKPPPQGPTSPSPQKPSVQKPQSASSAIDRPSKKVSAIPASRGTRWSPSTLTSMEAGPPHLPWADLASLHPHGVASSETDIQAAHGDRSIPSSFDDGIIVVLPLRPSMSYA